MGSSTIEGDSPSAYQRSPEVAARQALVCIEQATKIIEPFAMAEDPSVHDLSMIAAYRDALVAAFHLEAFLQFGQGSS